MRLCVHFFLFCFNLSSSCDIGEPGMGSALFHFWVVNPSEAHCACIPHSFISLDCCLPLSICVFISLCVASVALVFMPGLYPTAYRATFPAFLCVGSSLFLLSVCFVYVFLFYRDDVLCWLLPCPSFYVSFPCLSSIPGLIWFGSVYLVTTAGFVADQLCEKTTIPSSPEWSSR